MLRLSHHGPFRLCQTPYQIPSHVEHLKRMPFCPIPNAEPRFGLDTTHSAFEAINPLKIQ